MIPRLAPADESPPAAVAVGSWRRLLAEGVGSVAELLRALGLDERLSPAESDRAALDFPLRVPRGFLARMRPGDPDDPLLAQVLPRGVETEPVAGFTTDPVGELGGAGSGAAGDCGASPTAGLLHKYRGRALLVVTGACAVHCRYCFRRHFPYDEHVGEARWWRAVEHLAADPSIHEVILSGGDPLVVTDRRLARLAERLAAIPHLRRLRIHSRLPVVLPERVDDALLGWLTGSRLQPVMVIHANHPREIDGHVVAACERLRRAGVPVLNQTVLLAGVNDDADTLAELSEVLFAAGVTPYYLHLLDPVAGAAHFQVPEERARRIAGELAARLPGYLVPKLVREEAGVPAKRLLAPDLPASATTP